MLKSKGYRVKEYYGKKHANNKEYAVITYFIQRGEGPCITIVRSIVSPRRPYPVYAYIFAIAIYTLEPKMSLRKAAKITGECFGIPKFSASTICRLIKTLSGKACKLAGFFDKVAADPPCGDDDRVAALHGIEGHSEHIDESRPESAEETEGRDGEGKPSLKDVFGAACLKGFVGNLKNGIGYASEKIRFAEFVGRCCQKYYSLNRRLII